MKEKTQTGRKAEELAFQYVQNYGICAQCMVAAIMDAVGDGTINKAVVKAATGLGGGIGKSSSEICGAVSGGTLAIGAYAGRDYAGLKNGAEQFASLDLSRELLERFRMEYGGCTCLDVQKKVLKAGYILSDPEQAQKYKEAGGSSRECPIVCGKTARWVIEILQEHGMLEE